MKKELYAIAITLGMIGCTPNKEISIPSVIKAERNIITQEQREKYKSYFKVDFYDALHINISPKFQDIYKIGIDIIEPKQDSLATLVENFTIDYQGSKDSPTFKKEMEKIVQDSYILGLIETMQRRQRGANAFSVQFKIQIGKVESKKIYYSAIIDIYQ